MYESDYKSRTTCGSKSQSRAYGSETDIDEATSMLEMDVGDDFCGDKLEILVIVFLH